MYFKGFHINNYQSYGKDFYIDLLEGFPKDGEKNVMLIGAANGTGKTSFIKALKYTLYGFKNFTKGKTLTDSEICDLINNTSGNNKLSFQLDYISDMGENLSIFRSRDLDKVGNHETLDVLKDGKSLHMAQDEIVSYINNIIPEGIAKFFFFAGEDVEFFTNKQMTSGLKDSIETVLGINKFSKLIENLQKIKKRYTNQYSSGISDEGLKRLEKELDQKKLELATKREGAESIEKEKNDLTSEIETIKSQMDKLFNGDLLNQKGEIDEKMRTNKFRQERIKEKISEWKGILPNLLLKGQCGIIEKEIKYSKEINQAHSFQKEIDKIIKTLYQPEEVITHTKWDEKYYDILNRKLSELYGEKIVNKKDFILDINSHQESIINNTINEIKHPRTISGGELSDLLSEYEQLLRDYDKYEKEYEELSKNTSWKLEWDELNEQLGELNKKLGIKTAALSRMMGPDVYKLKEEIKRLENEIENYRQNISVQSELRSKIKKIDEYIDLLETYVETLRNREIEVAEKIIGDKYKEICHEDIKRVNIDPNNYNISILDSHNNIKVTNSLGDAEKTLFALSIIWGLGKISELDIPLVMDAPIAPLDQIHKENFLKIYVPTAGKQVVLLSNDEHIRPKGDFDIISPFTYNIKTFKKEGGFLQPIFVSVSDGYFKK